jgi:hypothetical protein
LSDFTAIKISDCFGFWDEFLNTEQTAPKQQTLSGREEHKITRGYTAQNLTVNYGFSNEIGY